MFRNHFRINDWKLTETLKAVLILQLVVLALVGGDAVGVHLPLARALAGVAYLLFVPGILILRVLHPMASTARESCSSPLASASRLLCSLVFS
jgi:uncharacterized membrane protein